MLNMLKEREKRGELGAIFINGWFWIREPKKEQQYLVFYYAEAFRSGRWIKTRSHLSSLPYCDCWTQVQVKGRGNSLSWKIGHVKDH